MTSALFRDTQLADIGRDGDYGSTHFPLWIDLPPRYVALHGDQFLLWHQERRNDALADWDLETLLTPPETAGALKAFVNIRDAEDVLEFALRYGAIGFCKHHLPHTHNAGLGFSYLWRRGRHAPGTVPWRRQKTRIYIQGCSPRRLSKARRRWTPMIDEIADWLLFVDHARSLLAIAARVHQQRVPPRHLFKIQDSRWQPSIKDASWYVEQEVNDWLMLSRAHLALHSYMGLKSPYVYCMTSTFGVIAIQLASAVTRAHSIMQCSGCGMTYTRTGRLAPAGTKNFCDACREFGVDSRLRQREHRVRKKGRVNGEEG